MTIRTTALSGLMCLALTLSASGRQDKPAAKVYKTPQEVFDAFVGALNKSDAKTFVGCLTPKALNNQAGRFALQGIQQRVLAEKDEKYAKQFAPTLKVLDRHGLTVAATKDIKPASSDKELEKVREELLKKVKDRTAFAADYLAALHEASPKDKDSKVEAKLSDVKVTGKKATGTVTAKFMGKSQKDTFEFEKVGEGWKINPEPRPRSKSAKDKDKKVDKQ